MNRNSNMRAYKITLPLILSGLFASTSSISVAQESSVLHEILQSQNGKWYSGDSDYNFFAGPWIFSGYREVNPISFDLPTLTLHPGNWEYSEGLEYFENEEDMEAQMMERAAKEIARAVAEEEEFEDYYNSLSSKEKQSLLEASGKKLAEDYREALALRQLKREQDQKLKEELPILTPGWIPGWLRQALTQDRIAQNLMYSMMVEVPTTIDFAYWNLPVPPRLPEEDHSFAAFIRSLDLPEIDASETVIETAAIRKKHWLHNAMAGIQFSQAYVSSNWYQGGNNNLALLLNALWDVQLNQVYHPDVMLQSVVSYKLGINSTPPDSYHKYSISEDLFQWNFKTGYKAFKQFYWSYNLLFKTQLLNNYESDSDIRQASFLSPGELNMGIGMTYNYTNKPKTLKVGVSLSPFSYNLKTCIDHKIDPTRFNIDPGKHSHSEFGTNLEVNVEWNVTSDISCRTRYFAFTNYHYFQQDLETTWNFTINRFLSTQIYAHLRYDGSSELTGSKWKHWMLKEILSFGLTYTFSTKP